MATRLPDFKIITDLPQALSKKVRELAPYFGETNKRFVIEAVKERLEQKQAELKKASLEKGSQEI